MQIIGAGLAGLIAANVFPQARIIEQQGRNKIEHKALLRFRSKVVADLTGIEFKKVKVHKGIWHIDRFVEPSIQLANLYSKKVIGRLADRSIWNLETVERYIAPEDFITQLIENAGNRISWNTSLETTHIAEPTISTIPMPVLAGIIQIKNCSAGISFDYSPIVVSRYRIIGADVYQTIYFTDPENGAYRASITGDLLIVEGIRVPLMNQILEAFALNDNDIVELDYIVQNFGKIAPIDDTWRKNFILQASMQRNIYSVGRFATWRNILLDDVVQDLNIVKRLIKTGHLYNNALGV